MFRRNIIFFAITHRSRTFQKIDAGSQNSIKVIRNIVYYWDNKYAAGLTEEGENILLLLDQLLQLRIIHRLEALACSQHLVNIDK